MTKAKHMTGQFSTNGLRRALGPASVGFAVRSDRTAAPRSRLPLVSLAKPRREQGDFGHLAAHSCRDGLVSLPAAPRPASWGREKLSRIEGVHSCGHLSRHLPLGFARLFPAAAKPRANRLSLAQARARLVLRCWTAIWSPARPSASQEISSTAKKTPAAAEGDFAAHELTCQPRGAAPVLQANAVDGPEARLRRFAFRHTNEQGTANV